LILHVGTKLFHFSAHVHVLSNINLKMSTLPTPLFPWKVVHRTCCWNKNIWQVIPMALVNCICNYNKRKGITNAFENWSCMCIENPINQCLWIIATTHHNYRLMSKTPSKHHGWKDSIKLFMRRINQFGIKP
jgi:hypothetical protein